MKNNLPSRLKKIISYINVCENISSSLVADVLSIIKLSAYDFIPFANFAHPDSESYGRNLIFESEKFKILLMSWRPGDYTAIHNHEHTEWGCIHFFGNTAHRLYEIKNGCMKLMRNDSFEKRRTVTVNSELIHLMGNSGTENFMTLHFYESGAHKIKNNAKIYIPEQKKMVTTSGSAYINMKKELILSEEQLCKIEPETLRDYFKLVKPFYERNKLKETVSKINSYLNKPTLFNLNKAAA